MTISMDKQYRTRSGERDAEIFAIRDGRAYGREKAISEGSPNGWYANSWPIDTADLIEVKPKITRTYWTVHHVEPYANYEQHETSFDNKEAALIWIERSTLGLDFIAITGPHTVEFTEGEGL